MVKIYKINYIKNVRKEKNKYGKLHVAYTAGKNAAS